MKINIIILSIITIFSSVKISEAFDFKGYQIILKKHVYENKTKSGIRINTVDYKKLIIEKNNPVSHYSRLLKKLSKFNPSSLKTQNDKIAFWINIYNIAAINLILKYYPVESIRSSNISLFKNPWGKKAISVGGQHYSLGYIEHIILLKKYNYAMSHFGIVCASVSCPDLSKKIFTAKNLESLLRKQALKFLSSQEKGMLIDRKNNILFLSQIFKFDKKNFENGKHDIIPFIIPLIMNKNDRKYLREKNYKLKFLKYNWLLNDKKTEE